MKMNRAAAAIFTLGIGLDAAGAQPTHLPPTRAQQLVDQTVSRHPELSGLEIAVVSDSGCHTIAATAPEDIGERCDADELGPIRTGQPDIEAPSRRDPVYDITQALHDATGALVGAVGMDLAPDHGETKADMLGKARAILVELEEQIPSKAALLGSPIRLDSHETTHP